MTKKSQKKFEFYERSFVIILNIFKLQNLILPKRVSEKEKKEIVQAFINGQSIEDLASKFDISKITISRHLKKEISDPKYKEIIQLNKKSKKNTAFKKENSLKSINYKTENKKINEDLSVPESSYQDYSFFEIEPLNCNFDNEPQKDLSSVPISEVVFPKLVYMIVDKKIELQTKYLKEYPEWQFLSEEELDRKTIEIFFDLKKAKRCCHKDQKVIKVPNTEVFRIATPSLLDKGISRIVTEDKLIAL